MKKRIIIFAISVIAFTALDWLVINAGWHKDWHEWLGYPIYHYVFWIMPALIVFWLFWNSRSSFLFNLFKCGAWLAVFAVMEDALYLGWYGITNNIYPYPNSAWQEAYYGWFGKTMGHEWWFGLPLGYFIGAIFLGAVYSIRIITPKRYIWCDELNSSRLRCLGI